MPLNEATVVSFPDQSGLCDDPLTSLARDGARRLIAQALEAELALLLEEHADQTVSDGRQRLVRHGHLPERDIQTGIGPIAVKVPRVRDRGDVPSKDKIRFSSSLLPPYLRRTKSMEELIPWLYLKGLSTGDFKEALAALVGKNAKGLSSSTISRLTKQWQAEFETWRKADLSENQYVYIYADGIYITPRMEERQCLLVVMGVDAYGRKDILAISDGYRESTQSWREVLLDLQARGISVPPKLAVADGALGFWTALSEIFPDTKARALLVS